MEKRQQPQIIFEDDSILVLDKPASWTVNRADTTRYEKTIQDFVEEYLLKEHAKELPKLKASLQLLESDEEEFFDPKEAFIGRAGIVHRLDKETSGILLVAKTLDAFITLQKQFKERNVEKTYLALAHDAIAPLVGEVRVPIGRLPWNRKQFGIVAGGRDALTKYKVISNKKYLFGKRQLILSFVELYPKTGRTHQLRVHLKYMHHPVFSDYLYAGRKTAKEDRKILNRVFLHAARISFRHPQTGEKQTYESSLPKELQAVLEKGE